MNVTFSALLLLMAMACTGNKGAGSQGETASEDSAATQVQVSDTLVFENVNMVDSMAYKIKVGDYSSDEEPAPYTLETVTDYYRLSTLKAVAGKPEVVEFINQWLTISAARESVEEAVTAENVAKQYAKLKEDGITDVRSAFKRASGVYLGENAAEDEEGMLEMGFASANEWEASVDVRWQTPTLLTLWKNGYDYSAGAAHGMPWEFGQTFDLKNLRLLTYDDILLKDSHEAVLKMVVEQLVDEYAESEMMNEPEDIDLPDCDPALVAEGVSFDYGAYEIGAYAMGMPGVIIPYDKIKPYLTKEVKELLGLE